MFMFRIIFARLFVFAALLSTSVSAAPECFAQKPYQNGGHAIKPANDSATGLRCRLKQSSKPVGRTYVHPASPSMAPILLPERIKPIEPAGIDPNLLQGAVNGPAPQDFSETVLVEPASVTEPPSIVSTLLFATLSLSLVFLGVRSIVFKKRAPLWSYGMVAAGILMLAGFWSLSFFDQGEVAVESASISALDVPTAIHVDANSDVHIYAGVNTARTSLRCGTSLIEAARKRGERPPGLASASTTTAAAPVMFPEN
jgi:hypothetical protein